MEWLPIVLAVVVVLVIAGTIVAVMMNREAERKKRTMSVISGKSAKTDKKVNENDEQNRRRADLAKKLNKQVYRGVLPNSGCFLLFVWLCLSRLRISWGKARLLFCLQPLSGF